MTSDNSKSNTFAECPTLAKRRIPFWKSMVIAVSLAVLTRILIEFVFACLAGRAVGFWSREAPDLLGHTLSTAIGVAIAFIFMRLYTQRRIQGK